MQIRDPGWKKFGSGIWDGKKLGSGIRDKHPGSDNTEENLSIFVREMIFHRITERPQKISLCSDN
jgi:hypothetical protein